MGKWRYSATILDLGTIWRWLVSFTPRPHYLRGNHPRYPLDRRLGGPQSRYGRYGKEKNFAFAGNRALAFRSVVRCYADWAIPDSPFQLALTTSPLIQPTYLKPPINFVVRRNTETVHNKFPKHPFQFFPPTSSTSGARGSEVAWGTILQAGRSRNRVLMRWIFFFQFT
jgi:hypothetical protein